MNEADIQIALLTTPQKLCILNPKAAAYAACPNGTPAHNSNGGECTCALCPTTEAWVRALPHRADWLGTAQARFTRTEGLLTLLGTHVLTRSREYGTSIPAPGRNTRSSTCSVAGRNIAYGRDGAGGASTKPKTVAQTWRPT